MPTPIPIRRFAWLLALASGVASAMAADSWIWFGESIPGEAVDPEHAEWCDLTSIVATTGDQGLTLTCVRPLDKATPLLMKSCAVNAGPLPQVKVEIARETPVGVREFWFLDLREVRIVSCDYDGGNGGVPTEVLKLSWKSLTVTYRNFPAGAEPYDISRLISADGDGDGLPDAYEEEFGLDPETSNRGEDSDGDGLLDTDEYRLGTHPNDPTSFFQAVATRNDPDNGQVVLTWPSVPGESYSVDYSADLLTPFNSVANVTATAPETSYAVSRILANGFFRVSSGEVP